MKFDLADIRRQFPILEKVIYLDSAATAQSPRAVIEAMSEFYLANRANVHRGLHPLAEKATELFEDARETVRIFLGAESHEEIIFTKGATESINLVAQSWGKTNLKNRDEIVLTILEHHSNITPWMQIKKDTGCTIRWIDIGGGEALKLEELDEILAGGKVRLVSVTGLSNVTGALTPLKKIIRKAHNAGAKVLIDAAQLAAHHPIDVKGLDCDFLAFSGHKVYGPMGIGVLYGKKALLDAMPPYQTGGGMIREVSSGHFTCLDLPEKFEAGTPPVAGAIGLKAAIEWLNQYNWRDIEEHENGLLRLAIGELGCITGLDILGNNNKQRRKVAWRPRRFTRATSNGQHHNSCCISFTIDGIHPHDLTDILGQKGICLRAGHHCAIPLHERLGVEASTRLSIGIYNTEEEIMRVRPAIEEIVRLFK